MRHHRFFTLAQANAEIRCLYSPARMERAAERALLTGAGRYRSVESILKNSLDALPVATDASTVTPAAHDYIRGSEYFN